MPGDAKPFLTHGVSEGDEIQVLEATVTLHMHLPGDHTVVFSGVLLTETVSRLKWR